MVIIVCTNECCDTALRNKVIHKKSSEDSGGLRDTELSSRSVRIHLFNISLPSQIQFLSVMCLFVDSFLFSI